MLHGGQEGQILVRKNDAPDEWEWRDPDHLDYARLDTPIGFRWFLVAFVFSAICLGMLALVLVSNLRFLT